METNMKTSVREFLADLAKARETQYDSISRIRRGDSDGEISLLYANKSLEEPLEIQILSTDVTSYPDDSGFMIFTSSETCNTKVLSLLEHIAFSSKGSTLHQVIQAVSNRLTACFNDTLESNSESHASLDHDTHDDESCDLLDLDYDESFQYNEEIRSSDTFPEVCGRLYEKEELQRLCKDLRTAQRAGIKVGIFPDPSHCPIEVISLSIRISKLGITSETMSAWDIKGTDYIVLLIRLPSGYPSLETLFNSPWTNPVVEFRFGTCPSVKPSIESVRLAFQYSPAATKCADTPDGMLSAFSPVCMSNAIGILLNKSFVSLFKFRTAYGHTWDEAQATMHEFAGRVQSKVVIKDKTGLIMDASHEAPISTHAPSSLQHDYALDDKAHISFPLVAMQFALRRFCKCTEYCIVCHLKLQTDFVPLKPYVCTKDLCLYQYLALGLGPNIEHEVISNPYVVDLLISFFYIGETQNGIREFPRGLALKVPLVQQSAPRLEIETCVQSQRFRILRAENESTNNSIRKRIRDGDWFVMLTNQTGFIEKHTCYVSKALNDDIYMFKAIDSITLPKNCTEFKTWTLPFNTTATQKAGLWQSGFIFPYEHDVDDLDAEERVVALTELLNSLPSVLQMRSYLLGESGRMLSSWQRINSSALSLMRWIVASNTSCIVQDGPVSSKDAEANVGNENTPLAATATTAKSNLIRPLEKGWMQFRFAQGSPEKEYAFLKTLREMMSNSKSTVKPPSLFVWHGSPISNWHSIIRTGLDFQQTRHGRSFGHGVYFSSYMSVSKRYSEGLGCYTKDPLRYSWTGSELRISLALGICEIVNKPEEFIASNPFFVVDKTEWIQCRYLLVQIDPTKEALNNPHFAPSDPGCTGYIEQDPKHLIRGEKDTQRLQIPLSALSIGRQNEALDATSATAALDPLVAVTSGMNDESCGSESGDDPGILVDDILKPYRATKSRKRQRNISPEQSYYGETWSQSPSKSPKKSATSFPGHSAFQPASLDYKTLPQLPPPSWATSSPMALQTLTRELKQIHTIQSQNHAASLGWSVDTSAVDNLFQWIVQFHSFDPGLPLAKDMRLREIKSIVLEFRFDSNFPISPPFVRVVRPRFLPFIEGGGGHVTAGGAICSEMLTNSGWSPAMSMENVFLQIRLGLCDTERPAKLDPRQERDRDYGIVEAVAAYIRAAKSHGWSIPEDLQTIHIGWGVPPAS